MKRKNILILLGSILVLIALTWFFTKPSGDQGQTIKTEVSSGQFIIDVTTTGELEARSSEKIQGPNPMKLRNARIWQYRIEDIIPDGTVVDSGMWVATLDRSDLENKIKDQELDVEKLQTQFLQKQLDTTMTLRAARDELINLQFTLEEKQIIVEQSLYEPPATQRQVKLDHEKTLRTYNQSVKNYQLKLQKANADMREVQANLNKSLNRMDEFTGLLGDFVIKAPKSGMVTYKKGWDGQKQGVGAQVSAWENVVATLPDLSAMNSKTFVNEIDISKVSKGQKAEIEIDAFPGKTFDGSVFEVANMGEQMKNSNAKVFEVIVHVEGFDSILRPSMTTKNRIITNIIDSVLFLPIECVSSNDSISYVYFQGNRKQVIPGQSNESSIIILEGLKKGDKVYLVPPSNAEEWDIEFLDQAIIEKYKKEEEILESEEMVETQQPEENNKPMKGKMGKGGSKKKTHKN
jgi:multidrug efflux pump subunit AcrA (membrane-fusion protein)